MRSRTALSGAIIAAALLSACGSGSNRYSEADRDLRSDRELCTIEKDRIFELEDQLANARDLLAVLEERRYRLQASAEDLRANLDRLSNEDWRDVVPDIEGSADFVEDDLDALAHELEDTENALWER